jgi:hypothetical protein
MPLKQARILAGVSYPTVRRWYSEFRDHLPKELQNNLLSGSIACDEMYMKGSSILGAKEKGTRKIALQVLDKPSVNKKEAMEFLLQFVRGNSELHTDGAAIYRGVGNWHKLKHSYELHKKWEFSLTAEIEGVWGNFRTFVRRMYHHVTRYKLKAVVAEFCLRFSQHKIFQTPYDYLALCLKQQPFAL